MFCSRRSRTSKLLNGKPASAEQKNNPHPQTKAACLHKMHNFLWYVRLLFLMWKLPWIRLLGDSRPLIGETNHLWSNQIVLFRVGMTLDRQVKRKWPEK